MCDFSDAVREVFPGTPVTRDGYMFVNEALGLGIDIDEKAASKYPYMMARLPVNRKTDGTMFNW